jgi:hypothetical protein
MILHSSDGKSYILTETKPFKSDSTIGYIDKTIDGQIYRFFFVFPNMNKLYVRINKTWYEMDFCLSPEFYREKFMEV